MKYYKTLKVYKSNNLYFNPETMHATSYRWYDLLKVVNGKLLFNSYNYSNSTIKHKHKLSHVLNSLNITPDEYIDAPQGLQRLDVALSHYHNLIDTKTEYMNRPKVRQKTKNSLKLEIQQLKQKELFLLTVLGKNAQAIKNKVGVV